MDLSDSDAFAALLDALADRDSSYSLFAGAGISIRAGVPSGPDIADQLKDEYGTDEWGEVDYVEAWRRALPGPENRAERRSLIEGWLSGNAPIHGGYPDAFDETGEIGNHYLVAKLVEDGVFDDVLTTNFDHLLEITYSVVCSRQHRIFRYDDEIEAHELADEVPKLFKLHGDFLFDDLANLSEEMRRRIRGNMRRKIVSHLQDRGLVVVGYGGNDESVMELFRDAARSPAGLADGVWWVSYSPVDLEAAEYAELRRLRSVVRAQGKPFHLIAPDRDDRLPARTIFHTLAHRLDCGLPEVAPFGFTESVTFPRNFLSNAFGPPRQELPVLDEDVTASEIVDADRLESTLDRLDGDRSVSWLVVDDHPETSEAIGSVLRRRFTPSDVFYYNYRFGRGQPEESLKTDLLRFANGRDISLKSDRSTNGIVRALLESGATLVFDHIDARTDRPSLEETAVQRLAKIVAIATTQRAGNVILVGRDPASTALTLLGWANARPGVDVTDVARLVQVDDLADSSAEGIDGPSASELAATLRAGEELSFADIGLLETDIGTRDGALDTDSARAVYEGFSDRRRRLVDRLAYLRFAETADDLAVLLSADGVADDLEALRTAGAIEYRFKRYYLLQPVREVAIERSLRDRDPEALNRLLEGLGDGYVQLKDDAKQHQLIHYTLEAENLLWNAGALRKSIDLLGGFMIFASDRTLSSFLFHTMYQYLDLIGGREHDAFFSEVPFMRQLQFVAGIYHTWRFCGSPRRAEFLSRFLALESDCFKRWTSVQYELLAARIAMTDDDIELAREALQAAADSVDAESEPFIAGYVHGQLGNLYDAIRLSSEYPSDDELPDYRIAHYREALALFETASQERFAARTRDNLAAVHIEIGQYETALEVLLEIDEHFRSIPGYSNTKAIFYSNLAKAHLGLAAREYPDGDALERLRKAEGFFFESLLNYTTTNDYDGIARLTPMLLGVIVEAYEENSEHSPDPMALLDGLLNLFALRPNDLYPIAIRVMVTFDIWISETDQSSFLEAYPERQRRFVRLVVRERTEVEATGYLLGSFRRLVAAFGIRPVEPAFERVASAVEAIENIDLTQFVDEHADDPEPADQPTERSPGGILRAANDHVPHERVDEEIGL